MRHLKLFAFVLWALVLFLAGELAAEFCKRTSRWRLK
jgi:hypothetical protein